MATPTEYRSTDGSAPVLTDAAGSLIALLDAILVNGYGALPAAGWAKTFSGTNLAAYQNDGLGHYLYCDDTAQRMCRVIGFEYMESISFGRFLFPTTAQFSGGLYARKSISTDATARPWICFATDKTFYLIIKSSTTTLAQNAGDTNLAFGELATTQVGNRFDKHKAFLIAASDSSTTSTAFAPSTRQTIIGLNVAPPTVTLAGHYAARPISGFGGSIPLGAVANTFLGSLPVSSGSSTACATYPEPVTGYLLMSQMIATEAINNAVGAVPRGIYPGIWAIAHSYAALTQFDTFGGTGILSGKAFVLVACGNGMVAFETNGGW